MKKKNNIRLGNLIIITASFLSVVLLIFFESNDPYYWHFFIIPLLIATFTYNLAGGLTVWFLFAGLAVWFMIDHGYPLDGAGAYSDLLIALGIALGLGVYSKKMKKTKALLEKLSERDSLTNLENYSCFINRINEEKKRSDRYETPFSLIMMDIDHFKKFNDTYGHEAGNKVLKKIAATIEDHVRSVDLGARYGGEEFAVVLTNADSDGALKFAERLHNAVRGLLFNFDGKQQSITVSMGVSTYPKDASSTTEFIVNADQALYKAKTRGRNRVCVYSSPCRRRSLDHVFI